MQPNNRAFTLIELLVVVLIIGILAAVALPQYQKAVEKSKSNQALTLLNTVRQSIAAYYMEHGSYPNSFDELDVTIPWTSRTRWVNWGTNDKRSNQEWSIEFYNGTTVVSLLMGRLNGPYKGGGFTYFFTDWGAPPGLYVPAGTLTCTENQRHITTQGNYCKKLFHSTLRMQAGTDMSFWNLP